MVRTLGVPTPITPERVERHRQELASQAYEAGRPLTPTIGLLFGGNDRRYRWTLDQAERIVETLLSVAAQAGMQLAIATSRRTPPEIEGYLKARLVESPLCGFAAFASEPPPTLEPVLSILALSLWVGVTVDSFSMVCEAASSGKPVAVLEIPARRRDRYAPAYQKIAEETGLRRTGLPTLYEFSLSMTYRPPQVRPLRDAETAANGIRRLFVENREQWNALSSRSAESS
ncbi:MAG: hypothetical protein KatS3mg115_1618 [Candidatus Poribacteria bacterium]|nr:MAG: hypothetical protein KatS3mg115_1618 [Candidatus Poribacteria bacterium]